MVANWRLRGVTIADLGFIYRVYKITMKPYIEQLQEWDDTAQHQHYNDTFSVDDYQVIQLDDKDIGVVSLIVKNDYDFLSRIEIMPDYQNQGIGTSIMQSLIKQATENNRPIMLRVFKINRAKNLYLRLGFQIVRQDDTYFEMLYATVDE